MSRTVSLDSGFNLYKALQLKNKIGNDPVYDWSKLSIKDKLYFGNKAQKKTTLPKTYVFKS